MTETTKSKSLARLQALEAVAEAARTMEECGFGTPALVMALRALDALPADPAPARGEREEVAAVIPAIENAALERAAVVAETHQAEVQRNIDGNIAEVRDIQITPLDNWPLIKARDWLKHTAAAIRALKETKE